MTNFEKDEYKNLLNDVVKFATILIIINFLMFISDTTNNRFLGERYLGIMMFFIAGIFTYWLLIFPYIRFD
jgi:hypothetical protein